jgi:hypothetical protein
MAILNFMLTVSRNNDLQAIHLKSELHGRIKFEKSSFIEISER